MAITVMCDKNDPGARRDDYWSKCQECHQDHGVEPEAICCRKCKVAGAAKRTIRHSAADGHPYTTYVCAACPDETSFEHSIYLKTTHVGLVLGLRERNGYDDSDFFAVVWNPEKGESQEIEYASTRGWTYPNGAVVDATPEVLKAHQAWLDKRHAEAMRLALEAEAKEPKVGRQVKVIKGRKLAHGTVAWVFWYGPDKFEDRRYTPSFFRRKMRVGIKLVDGTKHFMSADNVAVIQDNE